MSWSGSLILEPQILPPVDSKAVPISSELVISPNHNPTGKKSSSYSRRKTEAIDILLRFPRIQDAAIALGVHVNTLINWRKRPDFIESFNAAKKELMHAASTRAQERALSVMDVLYQVTQDANTSDMAKVAACKTLLDYAIRFNASEDLERRLEALERQATAYEPSRDNGQNNETGASSGPEQDD